MKLAYLDTSVWIAQSEGNMAYRQYIKSRLSSLIAENWGFCYSDLVVLETLLKPNREDRHPIISRYKNVFSKAILLPTFESIFQAAQEHSKTDRLKSVDAMHAAIAVRNECDLFVTTDPDFRHLVSLPLHWIDLSQVVIT